MKRLVDFMKAVLFVWKHGEKEVVRDSLTGLYNRLIADELMKKEINKSERYGHPCCMILLDVDGLKKINDTKGHLEGDKALSRIAQAIKRNLRDSDIGCRWGGDEFLLMLTHTDKIGAKNFLERIRQDFSLKINAGITEWKEGMSFEMMILSSDERMYEEKEKKKA